jgi:CheY-like chemotaxis protein/signal transduction histidine kinase
MSGVEFVKKTAKEVIKIEKDEPLPTSPVVVPKLESICSASDNMRNINNFMLMTINRSIDFTKATKGLVLIPHYDTVNIEESLKTVVDCMTDLQQRIPIKVNPLPNDISKYILTDKTWFQENMLCLLSNAVRYSIIGSVTISISLTTNDELKQLSSLFINTMKGVQRPSSVNRSGRRLSVESSTGRKKQKDDAEKEDSESTGRRLGSLQISIAEDDDEMINDVDRDTSIQKPMLLVEVEDYGKGLSNHEMLNLFRPSEQVQQSLGGTGLGMYSLSRRVLTLDGYYGVRLKKDKIPNAKGSIFWFGIPYIIDSEADLDSDHSSADHQEVSLNTSLEPNLMSKIAARDRGPEARILLVDNSFSVLKLLAMNLRSEGFDVDEIENGIFFLEVMKNSVKTGLSRAENDATECAKRNGDSSSNKLPSLYDVVLIDVHMEPMSGVEAVKEFRDFESKEMTGYSRQRIIFMSASSDDITSDGVQAADVDGFLTKPLEMIKLKELLTNFHKLKFFQL